MNKKFWLYGLLASLSVTISACGSDDDDDETPTPTETDADADGVSLEDGDCNDNDASIKPGATEICDDVDQDCDDQVDEGVKTVFYQDSDKDSFGNSASFKEACTAPADYVDNKTDCNDGDKAVNPNGTEVCDGVDNNCDGQVDEGVKTVFYQDSDKDSFGNSASSQEACTAPADYVDNKTDCNDGDLAVNPNATEVCDGVDNNCDGQVDEGVKTIFYQDGDSDSFGTSDTTIETKEACSAPTGYVANKTDCNDGDLAVNPNATEVCDGVDNNCDGQVDEGVKTIFYHDHDKDTFGSVDMTEEACTAPTDYVTNSTDCNDHDENVNPFATEVCDDATDNDCDTLTDDEDTQTWYADADTDGFGDSDVVELSCAQPSGYVSDSTDCDDNDDSAYPSASESATCDGTDSNCDDNFDSDVLISVYPDIDTDGFGDKDSSSQEKACTDLEGFVEDNTDCNDADANVNPNATEVCDDSTDNDCDGLTDVDDTQTWYSDADTDGFGSSLTSQESCTAPTGYVSDSTDCDDNDSNVNPNAEEICDGVDSNCDEDYDSDLFKTYYLDSDADGFGDINNIATECSAPDEYVEDNTDCNDNDASVNPNATEVDDDTDNNCNGETDEGFFWSFLF